MDKFLISGARVRGFEDLQDILVSKGRIVQIKPVEKIPDARIKRIDVEGRWVYPSFINSHTHLDKALMTWAANEKSLYVGGKEVGSMALVKRELSAANVQERGSKVIESAVSSGTTFIRTHVDIDPIVELRGLEGVLRLKERYADHVYIQIVAFAQEGFQCDPKVFDLMKEAVGMGAEVVGGKPTSDGEQRMQSIDRMFEIAASFGCDLDVHVDTDIEKDYHRKVSIHADGRLYPDELEAVHLAERTIEHGMQGRVVASHLCALDTLKPELRSNVVSLLQKAQVGVITSPSVCLYIEARGDTHNTRRGATRAKELLQAGVCTAYATDNIGDAFNLYSNANMLAHGWLTAMMFHMKTVEDIQTVMDMGTLHPAKLLRLERYGLSPGCDASLIVFDGTDFYDIFVNNKVPKLVFFSGRLVAANQRESTLML